MTKSNTAPVVPLPPRPQREVKTYPVCSFKKACILIESNCGNVRISERHGSGPNKVIILPEAMQELTSIVSYGRRSPMNAKEQKLTGYGHFLVDEKGNVIVIIKHFIEIQTMNRSAVSAYNLGPNGEYNPGLDFLEYHREEFLSTEAKFNTDAFGYLIDPFMKLCGSSEYVAEIHTHPDLGTFYSAPDRKSGAARAAAAPVCIFVIDPIRKEMLGSIGSCFAEAEVIVYERMLGESAAVNTKTEVEAEADSQTLPCDEIARLARKCLRTRGYSGSIETRSRFSDNRAVMKIKLVLPFEGE